MTSQDPPTLTQADEPHLSGRRRWVALLFLSLGVAMIILDGTVVNVAIPTMVKDLNLTTTDAEWVNAVYALAFASLLLLSGRFADLFGRRMLFLTGVALFGLASVLVATSAGSLHLIGSRALQGVAAAMILPASLSVLNAVYRGRARAIAFAVWGATIGGMAALGPLVGGWLTTYASWHWAFLINVPIAVVVVVMVAWLVPETRDPELRRGIDLGGALLGTLGLGLLVFGVIEGQNYGWIAPKRTFAIGAWQWPLTSVSVAAVALAGGVALLCLLVWVELRRLRGGRIVLLDLRLFRVRTFGGGNLVALLVSLGEFGLLFTLPLFLQSVGGYDALQTGVILLALAAGSFIASGAGAPMAQRFGPVRVVRLGMLLEVLGILAIALLITPTVTGWALAPGLFVYGAGVGFATAQLTGVILADVPLAESGQASAVQSTSRQVGAAIGTALLGATLIAGLGSVAGELTDRGVAPEQAQQVGAVVQNSAGQAVVGLSSQPDGAVLFQGAAEGFASATRDVGLVAAALVFLGLVAAMFLPTNAARTERAGYVTAEAERESLAAD